MLEEKLRGVREVKELTSTSRAGLSNVVVELRDDVVNVDPIWAMVRDRLSEPSPVFRLEFGVPRSAALN